MPKPSFEIMKVPLKKLGSHLLKKFALELINQGHRATGSLISSFHQEIMFVENGYSIVFWCNDYGLYLEKKRQPGKYVPIAPLMKWVAQKGMASTNKEVRSIAFAISRAIFMEGIPTTGRRTPKGRGAFIHSKVGRRTAWISHTVKTNNDFIKSTINQAFKSQINTTVTNIIRNTNKKLK